MIGAKPGSHVLVIGAANAALAAEVALVTGLNGRTVVIERAAGSQAAIESAAARAGALIDFEDAPATMLPLDTDTFDIVIIRRSLADADRSQIVSESIRVVRPGGRVVVINTAIRAGFFGAIRSASKAAVDPQLVIDALRAAGLKAVRLLGQTDDVAFIEGTKPRSIAST